MLVKEVWISVREVPIVKNPLWRKGKYGNCVFQNTIFKMYHYVCVCVVFVCVCVSLFQTSYWLRYTWFVHLVLMLCTHEHVWLLFTCCATHSGIVLECKPVCIVYENQAVNLCLHEFLCRLCMYWACACVCMCIRRGVCGSVGAYVVI